LHPARSPPRAEGTGRAAPGSPAVSALCDKHVSSVGQRAPSVRDLLLCEGWEALFVGRLLPPARISSQSNLCLNCSSAALLRESKDSLLEMDVVLPLGVAAVLSSHSVRHHSPTYVRRQEIYRRSQWFGAPAPGVGT